MHFLIIFAVIMQYEFNELNFLNETVTKIKLLNETTTKTLNIPEWAHMWQAWFTKMSCFSFFISFFFFFLKKYN